LKIKTPTQIMARSILLFRRVPCRNGYMDTEIFVMLRDGMFRLPTELPKRFEGRTQVTDLDFVLQVYSSPFEIPTLVTLESLAQDGLWITEDDTMRRGGVDPRVFGIPMDSDVASAWLVLPQEPSKLGPWRIRVGYHGTDGASMSNIAKENVLRPSLGQLGLGVYTGSFWKACRFAVRDQDYAPKLNPCVLRVLWMCDESKQLHFPRKSPCRCKMFCDGKPVEDAQACGHELDWRGELPWQSGSLAPSQLPSGRWITKNEEWVCSPSAVQRLQQVAFIDTASVDGPHYNPLQRNIRIF
jgi:hypothetical protein